MAKDPDVAAKQEDERLIEQWKTKKLIKSLSEAHGNGTSMISLILPPGTQIAQISKMLSQEESTATNIKSRVNRLSVLSAITSVRERLKLYNKTPPNGLVIYCGEIITIDGKTKKLSIHFEPFKPINKKLYLCDNKFHVKPLIKLLKDDSIFGFIIMDGKGCYYGTLCGDHHEIKRKLNVELPKKHGRGGQSAARFGRLRMEARHNYIKKSAENANEQFITGDRPNVKGLVIAGCASLKNELNDSDIFDSRLKKIVRKVVDISYGGERGLIQAIDLSKEALANVKYIREQKLLIQYMAEIGQNTNKYCYGIRDTIRALEMGVVETLIVYENLNIIRVSMKNSNANNNDNNNDKKEEYLTPDEYKKQEFLTDSQNGVKWDITQEIDFLEWLTENYKSFGAKLEFVGNRTQDGTQFVKAFSGIGGLLRYPVDMVQVNDFIGIDDECWNWN